MAMSVEGSQTYLILVLLQSVQDVLGTERIFAVARAERDDGVLDLLGREDRVVQLGMRVDRVLLYQPHPLSLPCAFPPHFVASPFALPPTCLCRRESLQA